jgi:hydrogenase nickel incorporation protein HypA/HybF
MHEYSIVSALLDRVETEARTRGATGVHGVQVRIGDLAGVDRDLFRSAFETFRANTLCARAVLLVVPVEARWACPRCGNPLPRGAVLRCEACGDPARLECGDEIVLDRVELEVP